MKKSKTAFSAALLIATTFSTLAFECEIDVSFKQSDGNSKTGFTDVLSDKNMTSLLFVQTLNVNTDFT